MANQSKKKLFPGIIIIIIQCSKCTEAKIISVGSYSFTGY